MSPNPAAFAQHLSTHGYHPRSNKHSNALAEAIAADLVVHCSTLRAMAARGEIVYDLNFNLKAGTADWNVDLVLGAPQLGTQPPEEGIPIRRDVPSSIQIAIEIKSVMTEHRKAVKNRKRDLEAHHEHVHNYSNDAVAGGVLVINASEQFHSPLRSAVTKHRDPTRLVEHCIRELRSVAVRGGRTGYGLEARCAIVVCCENVQGSGASFVTSRPAPSVGDPLHYDAFIQSVCNHFTTRFASTR